MTEDARATLDRLRRRLTVHLGGELLGLFLFGSLATGAFIRDRSDLDLLAVLTSDVAEGGQLDALRALHERFVTEHPAWRERVEVGYVGQAVLPTFAGDPHGRIAVISPGEPLHIKDAGHDWVLNWHGVCTHGEILLGPSPLALASAVSPDAFRRAVRVQLDAWRSAVRDPTVAYVPAHRGYIVVTLCRALCALATGEQASKEQAVSWVAHRYPAWACLVRESLAQHRADPSPAHRATIDFVDAALDEAERLGNAVANPHFPMLP